MATIDNKFNEKLAKEMDNDRWLCVKEPLMDKYRLTTKEFALYETMFRLNPAMQKQFQNANANFEDVGGYIAALGKYIEVRQ